MKRFFLLLFSILPMIVAAQGHKGTVESCAPTREGKVLYSDKVEVKDSDRQEIFQSIHAWAKENYGKDVFISSVSANKNKGTLFIGSKVELLLNDSEKTIVKYKMRINCQDNGYSVEVTDISYQYSPGGEAKTKTYPAEDVIMGNGKGNTVTAIKDPVLFCNATYFFVESLFADVYDAVEN